MLFFTERKASKELQAYRLTVCAAGDGSVAAMKDGVHAHFVRVIRQPPPLSQASHRSGSHGARLAPAGTEFPVAQIPPHGEWWPVRAPRALQHLRAVGIRFSAEA